MDQVDSMLDIEQLRLSVNEESIYNAIAQIHQWINTHGYSLLKSNNKFPFDFHEAEEVRKLHEKVELKCMKFLAFYAQMNMRAIPEDCEPMRQNTDIAIYNFSERIRSRRHVVVSFFTFYRHLDELHSMLNSIKDEDHINLPDTLVDVEKVIEKCHSSNQSCVRKFAHLKDEAVRVKLALDAVLKFENEAESSLVDVSNVQKVSKHIDELLQQMENVLLDSYENQYLLEMEIKIESKMMLIEEEIARSSNWIEQIERTILEKYANSAVGKSTMENMVLQKEYQEIISKLELAHDYGRKLMQLYKKLCGQFERDTGRGDRSSSKFEEVWNQANIIARESTDRLKLAGNLFLKLDTTLDKVEDLLLIINKDHLSMEKLESILHQHESEVTEIHVEFQIIKKLENNALNKICTNLHKIKLMHDSPEYLEVEEIESIVKMKIFTLLVKIKSLDRYFNKDNNQIHSFVALKDSAAVLSDNDNSDLINMIKKYNDFLNTSKLNWRSKHLPKSIDNLTRAIEAHKNLAIQSNNYMDDIYNAMKEYFNLSKKNSEDQEILNLMSNTEKNRANWDKLWNEHLKLKLNPRLEFLLKIQRFGEMLEEDLNTLDDLVTRPNHSLPLVRDLKEDLERMKSKKSHETLLELKKECQQFHKSDFNNILSSLEDKLKYFNNRLDQFIKLEKMILEIHEFLPKLNSFKNEWDSRVNMCRNNPNEIAELKSEAQQIISKIDTFNINELRRLATVIYGSSKRIEWLIDELRVDFRIPKEKSPKVHKGHHNLESAIEPAIVKETHSKNSTSPYNKKLLFVNAESETPTKLNFEFETLPRIENDQYDLQWYKDDEPIYPNRDPRVFIHCNAQTGQINVNIDKCQESDAGKYWCEYNGSSSGVQKSSPVLLSVVPVKQGTVIPQFSERTYASNNKPFSFKLKFQGFKYAPETNLIFNNNPINVNHKSCPWARISSNEFLEFKNPFITPKERGLYEFQVSGQVVATTKLEVDDAPSFVFHDFSEQCQIGEQTHIAIPMKNFKNISQNNIVLTKDDVLLTPDMLNYGIYIKNSGELVLDIPCFTPAHAGCYSCQVSNEFGTDTLTLNLEEKETERSQMINPLAKSINHHVIANVGEPVIIDYNSTPGSNNKVLWTKDNHPIYNTNPRIKISNEDPSKSSLRIEDSVPDDSGTYRAVNKDTGQSKTTVVEIKPLLYAPVIQEYPKSLRVKLNGEISIVCIVNSSPFAKSVNWSVKPAAGSTLRNLRNNARYKISNEPINNISDHMQKIELYFDNIKASDAGDYCLHIENDIGSSSLIIPVTISNSQYTKMIPKFLQPLHEEVRARIGDDVSLKCKVAGNPIPIVKWLKNNMVLKESGRVKLAKFGESNEVVISNLQNSDSGIYQACASNSEGFQVSKCQLKVAGSSHNFNLPLDELISPTSVSKDKFEPDDNSDISSPRRTQMIFSNTIVRSPPQFVTTFSDQIVNEGDDVILKCCLIGHPEPVVWWSYNTHFINNPRFELSRKFDEYFLLMKNIRKEDSGRYSITAENNSGLATCSALVIVDNDRTNGFVDRSKYPTNSTSLGRQHYSNIMSPRIDDESRIMQVSPMGWKDIPKQSSPRHFQKSSDIPDSDYLYEHDISKTKTETIKTYHYSGPSGVELPGIGFIPKINTYPCKSSSASSSSSKPHVERAKFVPGDQKMLDSKPAQKLSTYEECNRFSVVESSDCDFPI